MRHDIDNSVSKTSRLRELRIFRFLRLRARATHIISLKLMFIFIGWNLENMQRSTYHLLFFILAITNMQIVFRKLQYRALKKKKRRKMQNRGNHKSVISGRKYFKARIPTTTGGSVF